MIAPPGLAQVSWLAGMGRSRVRFLKSRLRPGSRTEYRGGQNGSAPGHRRTTDVNELAAAIPLLTLSMAILDVRDETSDMGAMGAVTAPRDAG